MAANFFDQFDSEPATTAATNFFDQFDQPVAQKPAPKVVAPPPTRPVMPPAPVPQEFKAPDGKTYVFPSADAAAGFQKSLQGVEATPDRVGIYALQYGGKPAQATAPAQAPAQNSQKPAFAIQAQMTPEKWSAIGGRGQPIKKPESITSGYVAGQGKQEPLPSAERYVVDPKFIQAVETELNAVPKESRDKVLARLVQRNDAYGRAARDIQGRYQAMDKLTPEAKQVFDPRLEAQAKKLEVKGGMDPQSAKAWAAQSLRRGVTPQVLPSAVRDVAAEQAALAGQKVKQEMEGAGFGARVGAEIGTRARQTGLGLAQIYADVAGDDELQKNLSYYRKLETAKGEAIPKGESIAERSAQQAIASLGGQAPMMVLGAMTGTALPVLAQAGIEVFSQNYGQGRSAGLKPAEAGSRAGLMAVSEILFERYGLGDQLKALRGLIDRVPTKDLSGYITASFLKEIPAEQATTLSQFLVDKLPGLGLNQDAGLKDYLEQAAETLRQTVIASGASNAAIYGASKSERAFSEKVLPAVSSKMAVARAIGQDAERVEPTLAGLRAQSAVDGTQTVRAGRTEPTISTEFVAPERPGRVEPTVGAGPLPPTPGERVEPTMGGAPAAPRAETPATVPVVPGMPTGEEVEELPVTPVTRTAPAAEAPKAEPETKAPPVTPVTDAAAELPFTPTGKGPSFKGSVAPTTAAARLPDTPTVAPVKPVKEFEPAAKPQEFSGLPIAEVPIKDIYQSPDLPQFKAGANEKGVVEPLEGKFERTGVAPIQLWQRLDNKLYIMSGRHRLDLANRSGETTIPAQIHYESDGFTLDKATTLDAELNIRDGQGKTKDYVDYFKGSKITREEADARGLLARALGKRSYGIATQGSEELIAALRADQITDNDAFYIALNAPNDAKIQNVGMKAVLDGKSINMATNLMQAVRVMSSGGLRGGNLKLFGDDTEAMEEAAAMAEYAAKKQREVQNRLSAISGVAKRPELAKAEGINVNDLDAVKRREAELRQLKAKWDNWHSNSEAIAEIREAIGATPFELTSESEAERQAREDKEAAEKEEKERKAIADREVDLFGLTAPPSEEQAAPTGDLFTGENAPAAGYQAAYEPLRRATERLGKAETAYRNKEISKDDLEAVRDEYEKESVKFSETIRKLNEPTEPTETKEERVKKLRETKAEKPAEDVSEPEIKTGEIVRETKLPNGMVVNVFKTSDGYGTGLFDVDSNNYVDGSLTRYKGKGALARANKKADDAVAKATSIEKPAAKPKEVEPANIRQARKEMEAAAKTPGKVLTPAELSRRRDLIAYDQKKQAEALEAAGEKVVNGKPVDPNLPAKNRLVLMPCCDTKGDAKAPAMELYKGVFFQTLKSNQKSGAEPNIVILSAKHGFIEPTKEIEPYDQVMTPEKAEEFLLTLQRDMDSIDWPDGIKDVLIVGGKQYQRVMRAAVARLQEDGVISKDASINVTSGGIGNQRSQLGKYLQAIPAEQPISELTSAKEIANREEENKPNEEDSGFRGASDKEVSDVAGAFEAAKESQDDNKVTRVFDAPKKSDIVRLEDRTRVFVKDAGYMTVAQAKQRIAEWKKNASDQGKTSRNSDKVVLSLFDMTGEWSKPWEEAGYQVYRFDIQTDPEFGDVTKFSTEFFNDMYGAFEGNDIYAILAACPCTDFASSGSKHFAAKDADGRTIESVQLVRHTLATIEFFKPAVWAIENPVGRIEKLTGLPPWRLSFNPNHFGDPYTKKTLLWGRFNAELPIAPVEPTEGSKMHRMYGGKSKETKNARSVTPEGFAYSFFAANNAVDHPVMALANKYDMMDRAVLQKALDAGMSENGISEVIDDFYYDQEYKEAEQALDAKAESLKKQKAAPAKKPAAKKAAKPAEPTVKEETEEEKTNRENAEVLAKDVGGSVVWQKGIYALVRGYDVITGVPLYSPTFGTRRAIVDIKDYTGAKVPADIKQEMIAAKQKAEQEAEEKHKSAPFIKFVDGVAVSESISPEIEGIIREWKKLLKLDVPIYIATIEDARLHKNDYTGPHRVIGSGTLGNELGSTRRMADGSHYILFTKSTSPTFMLETLAHELGHVHQKTVYERASEADKKALKDAHQKWLATHKTKTAQEVVNTMRGRATGQRRVKAAPTQKGEELPPYWRKFEEWYADQTARWAVSNKAPVTAVEKFFKRLGNQLRRFYQQLKARKYLPDETFAQYMDRVTAQPPVLTPDEDDTAYWMSSDTGAPSIQPTAKFQEDIPNEGWLDGKIKYAMQKPRNQFGVPHMGSVTGYFSGPVYVPTRWFADVKGERGEQQNVREKDLAAIRKIISETGRFPIEESGEYVPYIEVGFDGVPWISEGNHRIMAALAEGIEYIPVEIRYFDGGQRRAGKWRPANLVDIQSSENVAAAVEERDAGGQDRASSMSVGIGSSSFRGPLGFYSALASGIDELKIASAPVQGWKDAIKGLVNKGAVKADEVEWSGVNDWLDLQQGKVSKQAISDYLKEGGVKVEETVLGEAKHAMETEEAYDNLREKIKNWDEPFEVEGKEYLGDRDQDEILDGLMGYSIDPADLPRGLQEPARRWVKSLEAENNDPAPTKYGSYALPGGENYREVLLTLPNRIDSYNRKIYEELEAIGDGPDQSKRRAELVSLLKKSEDSKYSSPHWGQPNVLAHIRINDRTDADGKRVLFVEEIQSDWGQAGKKKGFRPSQAEVAQVNSRIAELTKQINEIRASGVIYPEDGIPEGDVDPAFKALTKLLVERTELQSRDTSYTSLPIAAPFVTKTEGWLNLALKRIMVMAAEGGYDRVAFVNGEQSADRYNLSKQVDYIDYVREGPDNYLIAVVGKDGQGINLPKETFTAAELENYVGKDVAQRIVNGEGQSGGGRMTLRGPDLKVGGEGMKAFYDKIVPTALKKLLPKVGGGQIEMVNVQARDNRLAVVKRDGVFRVMDLNANVGNDLLSGTYDTPGLAVRAMNAMMRNDQLGFDITPSIRGKVEQGLPLFSVQKEPSIVNQEGDLIVGREAIREWQIKEYAKLRAALTRALKKVAAGEASISVQRNITHLMQEVRDLQVAIKTTAPRQDSAEQFLAKALKEYDAGNISQEVLDVIRAAYDKKPELLEGLLLSVVTPPEGNVASGSFKAISRIVRLYKNTEGAYDPSVIRHEVTHSLEQMMTPAQRAIVIQAWGKALSKAIKKYPGEKHQRYFNAILSFIDNPNNKTMKLAIAEMPSLDVYQFLNPSEFWAENAENLMRAELGGAWDKFKRAVRQFFEGLKKVFGIDNRYDIHKVFRQIMGGSKERLDKSSLADVLADYLTSTTDDQIELQSIQPEKDLMQRYSRPHTPMLDNTPVMTFLTNTYTNGKDFVTDAVTSPIQTAAAAERAVTDGLLNARNMSVWYGAGLESRDFARYQGQLRTSADIVTASVALDNAIRSGNIGVEVIFRGGLEYNARLGNFVAVERDKGMRGVYEAEAAIKKRLGNQLGTDIVQGYLEAKRSISIMDELRERTDALENAEQNLEALEAMMAPPEDIAEAKKAVDELKVDLEAINRAVSSVNMSEEEMYEFAALDEKHPELRTLMDNWTAVNQNLLRVWRQVGLISQGRYETLSAIKDYVPWYRIMNDDEDIHSAGQAVQSTTRSLVNIGREKLFKSGRPRNVVDIIATAGQQDFKIQPTSVVKVKVNGKKISPDLVTATPQGDVRINMALNEGDLVTFETNREIQNIIDNMTRNVMRMTMNGIRQFASNRIVLEYAVRNAEGKIRVYPSVNPEEGKFNWMVNGKKVVVQIQDPVVVASIYGMENLNLRMWAPMAAIANFLRRGVTLSGVFQVNQVFKDAPTAALVTGVRNPIALIGGVWKGFLTSLIQPGMKKAGVNVEPVIDILKAAGIGGFHSPARTPEAEIKRRLGIMNRNVYSAVIKTLDHIGDSSDMAQRVAVYKRVMAETGDQTQALYQAANVINFLHHGSAGFAQAAVKTVPFFGAWMNSTDVLINSLQGGGLKGMSRKKAIARLAVAATTLSTLTILYCMLAGGDPEYDELDDQTKLRSIMIPGTDIKMPINTSAALIFKAIPELIYNKITRDGTKNENDARRLRRALAEFARDALLGPEPIPAGVKTLLEVGINHSFFTGRQITPEALKNVEAAEQYVASTSELGKKLSAMTAIPGTERRVLNPMEADHIVRGLFGTAGAMAQWISNSIEASTRPAPTPREMPITGSFKRDEVPRGNEDLFYDLKEVVLKRHGTFEKLIERGDRKEAEAYLAKYRKSIAMYEYIQEADTELKEVNAEIKRLGESKDIKMTPEKRRELITKFQKVRNKILTPVKQIRRVALTE